MKEGECDSFACMCRNTNNEEKYTPILHTKTSNIKKFIIQPAVVNKFINEKRQSVTVLLARADLYSRQVFYYTNNYTISLYIGTFIWTVLAAVG